MSPAIVVYLRKPNPVINVVKKVTSFVDPSLLSFLYLIFLHFSGSLATVPKIAVTQGVVMAEVVILVLSVTNVVKSATSRGRAPKVLAVVALMVNLTALEPKRHG